MIEKKTIEIAHQSELSKVVDDVLALMENGPKIVFLYGDLGAGRKTTFVKEFVRVFRK